MESRYHIKPIISTAELCIDASASMHRAKLCNRGWVGPPCRDIEALCQRCDYLLFRSGCFGSTFISHFCVTLSKRSSNALALRISSICWVSHFTFCSGVGGFHSTGDHLPSGPKIFVRSAPALQYSPYSTPAEAGQGDRRRRDLRSP